MALPIVWAPVFQKAAEALAESFAKRLGEELGGAAGKALAEAIFGGGEAANAAWQAEVDLRLSRIEQKLDKIIDFLNNQLPALVYTQVTQAVLDQRVNDVKGARLAVTSAIIAFEADHSPSNAAALRSAADRIADLGYSLAQNGPAWHAATFLAFTSTVAAYSRLLSIDQSLLGALKNYASSYDLVIAGWLDPAVSRSFAEVRSARQRDLNTARAIVAQQPIGNFLLAVNRGPIKFGQPGYMGYADPQYGKMDTYWGTKAWIEKRGNYWGGDWGGGGGQNVVNFDEGGEFNISEFTRIHGWKVLDFIETPMPPQNNTQMGEQIARVLSIVNESQRRADEFPAHLLEIDTAMATSKGMRIAAGEIASLQ